MKLKESFESYLKNIIIENGLVSKAMNYSLLAQSKRIRPLLFLNALKDLDLDPMDYIDIACGIEMIHTYSLIHDDLPAMDNDDLRRGKPTCHKQFNEAIAILAGDGLLTESFNLVVKTNINNNKKIRIINEFSKMAGFNGMILGQELDIQTTDDYYKLCELEKLKTGCLLGLPLKCAAIIVDNEKLLDTFDEIGKNLGIAFQIQDDILDVTKTKEQLGKSNSDIDNHKITFISLLGLEKANEMMDNYYNLVLNELRNNNLNNCLELVNSLVKRVK